MTEEKQPSPSAKRENDTGAALKRLGFAETKDERYNNGFAHYSLAAPSSFIRAVEERLSQLIRPINVIIVGAVPAPCKNKEKMPDSNLIGKTVSFDRTIFPNTMTLTRWIENFYQESPSINKTAREDQVEILTKAYGVAPMVSFQPWGTQEARLDSN